MIFEAIIGGMAIFSLLLIIRNTRATRDFRVDISRSILASDKNKELIMFEGKTYEPIIYYSEDPVRDETGRLGERLANLARGVRINVTYVTSLFQVNKGRLLSYLEDQISKAQFGYQATRHVRYAERLRFLRRLYNEVARTHTPYLHRLSVIVWVEKGNDEAKARAEAFKSMVEAEAKIHLRKSKEPIVKSLLPSGSESFSSTTPSIIASTQESPGIVVGRDRDGRLVVLDWPRDFETHLGIFGPTGRGKTVLLHGISSQLASRSESKLDPYMVAVIDPKGDLTDLLSKQSTAMIVMSSGDCIPLPRLEGLAEILLGPVLESYATKSVKPCEGSILRRGLVVFDLSSLANEDRDIAASLILSSLVLEASEGILPGPVVVVIDEAWRLSIGGARHLIWALREGRSRGLHVVYATQSPEDLPDAVLNNTGTLVVFGGYTRSYTEAARRLGLDDARKLLELPVGTAMLKIKDFPPVEVRIFGFHEYVKKVEKQSIPGSDRGVSRIG